MRLLDLTNYVRSSLSYYTSSDAGGILKSVLRLNCSGQCSSSAGT